MRGLSLAVAATFLVSLLTVTESGVAQLEFKSIIDPIIKEILEKMRPKFANLRVEDINQVVNYPNLNLTFVAKDMIIKNLDKFVIKNLKTNMVPLKLQNLTLTWSDIVGSGVYDFDILLELPKFSGPFHIHGKGDAGISLKDVFFTVGANLEMKNKTLQVKPKGLFGFDIIIKSTQVKLSNLMGSKEFGEALGIFLGNIIPDLVNTLKKPVFDSFQDDIIRIVNEVLKSQLSYSGSQFEDEMLNESEEQLDYFDDSWQN